MVQLMRAAASWLLLAASCAGQLAADGRHVSSAFAHPRLLVPATAGPWSRCACRAARRWVVRSGLPTAETRIGNGHRSQFTAAATTMAVDVSPLTDVRYVRMLSQLCCESFYGVQSTWEKLNPFGQVQRGLVLQEIELDLKMRMDRYRRAASNAGSACGSILVAVDEQGELAGFVDVSLTLFDTSKGEFLLSQGPGLGVPSDQYVRRRYIANLGDFRID